MALLDFPASPINGQTYAPANGVTYRYVVPPGIWTTVSSGSGGGGEPVGPAGGDLTGTYPDPTLAIDRVMITGDTMTGGLGFTNAGAPVDWKNWKLQAQSGGQIQLLAYADNFTTLQKTWNFARNGQTTFPSDVFVSSTVNEGVFLAPAGWIDIYGLSASQCGIDFIRMDLAANQRIWYLSQNAIGGLELVAANDSYAALSTWLFNRNGDTVFSGVIDIKAPSGFGQMQIAGPSGAYLDLSSPGTDDYDLRFVTYGTGGSIISPGLISIESPNVNVSGYVNVQNDITIIRADYPGLHIYTTNGALNAKHWTIFNYAADGTLYVEATTDDDSTAQADFEFRRDGRFATKTLVVPHGAVPTTPVNGEVWSTTTGFYGRVNGTTVGPWGTGGGGGGAPSGPAGGDLAGTYPDPTLAVDRVMVTGDTMTGPLVLPLGTAAATSLNFGTAGTGIYSASTSQVNIATSSGMRITVGSSVMQAAVTISGPTGSAGAPTYSFTGATTNGIYRSATNQVAVATNGIDTMRWNADNTTTLLGALTGTSATFTGSVTVPVLTQTAATPSFYITKSSAAVDQRSWLWEPASNGSYVFASHADGFTLELARIVFLRNGGATFQGPVTGTTAAFSGQITAATATYPDNDTTVATTAYVTAAITAGGGGGAPTGPAGGALSGTYPNPSLAEAYLPLEGGSITGSVDMMELECTYVQINSTFAGMDFRKSDAGTDMKHWLVQPQDNGDMRLESYDDEFSVALKTWTFKHNGTTTFPGDISAPNIVDITVGTTAPSSPTVGDIWIDTN